MGSFRRNERKRLNSAPKNAGAQREERHKTAVALDQQRLEPAELKIMKAANGVAKLFDGIAPPETDKIAA